MSVSVSPRSLKIMQMIAGGAQSSEICEIFDFANPNYVPKVLNGDGIKPPSSIRGQRRAQWAKDWLAENGIEFENYQPTAKKIPPRTRRHYERRPTRSQKPSRPTAQANKGCRYFLAAEMKECGGKINLKKHPQYCEKCAAKSARGAMNMFNNFRDFSALI